MENLRLETLEKGSVLNKINAELTKIASDIADFQKQATSVRELKLSIKFAPNEDGRMGLITAQVSSALGKQAPIKTSAYFGEVEGKPIISQNHIPTLTGVDATEGESN